MNKRYRSNPLRIYEMLSYDIWYDEGMPYVNDISHTGLYYWVDPGWNDKQIIAALKKQGAIKKRIHTSSIELEGDSEDVIVLNYKGTPEFELRYDEDKQAEFMAKEIEYFGRQQKKPWKISDNIYETRFGTAPIDEIEEEYEKGLSRQLQKFTKDPPWTQLKLKLRKRRKSNKNPKKKYYERIEQIIPILRVAMKVGNNIYIGKKNDIHATIISKYDLDPETAESGWVDIDGQWIGRGKFDD